MDQIVSGGEKEEDLELDIEQGGGFNETQGITTSPDVLSEGILSDDVLSGRLSTEADADDDLLKRKGRSSQSLDLSDKVKFKKTRKAWKPPRPPKGPSLTANDHKLIKEITELAMRKRVRIERMKTLRRMRAAESSSSPCSSVFAIVVTVICFVFLISQGLFTSNASLSLDNAPGPSVSPNNRMVSVQFYNEFAPRERIDPSPTTSFRYKRVSGADNEENTRETTR